MKNKHIEILEAVIITFKKMDVSIKEETEYQVQQQALSTINPIPGINKNDFRVKSF